MHIRRMPEVFEFLVAQPHLGVHRADELLPALYRLRIGLTASLSSGLSAGFAFFGFRHFACSTCGLCAFRLALVVAFACG